MALRGLDHVQLAMPAGGEAAARGFYAGLLGLVEMPKPATLAGRGGCWFEEHDVRVHLGVDPDFRAATKAHPAFMVDGFDALLVTLAAAGCAVDAGDQLPGQRRAFTADPFGNRIELIASD